METYTVPEGQGRLSVVPRALLHDAKVFLTGSVQPYPRRPMLATMSTLMMPAATMTTMTNPAPIPVAQAKLEANSKPTLNNHNSSNKSGKKKIENFFMCEHDFLKIYLHCDFFFFFFLY